MAVQRLTSLAEGASAPATCPKGPFSLWHAADELGLLKIWTVEVSDSRGVINSGGQEAYCMVGSG